jgi:hypothetical protein
MKLQAPSRWVWRTAALAALGLVFASYLQPDVMVLLATQLWNCF